VQQASHRINEQECLLKSKQLELEQQTKAIMDESMEIKQREVMLQKEKQSFDEMYRRYNQKMIDDKLKNAEKLSKRMLEIEKKERKVLAEMDELEVNKIYLNKEKSLYRKERELIHQQQQQVFFNERQVQKQKDLISTDQTYIQREFIDSKEKFENDRFVLIDKINKLEIENNKYQISEQSLTKQLSLKTEMCMFLEEQMDAHKKTHHEKEQECNKLIQQEFISRQTINNLQSDVRIAKTKVEKLQSDAQETAQSNMQIIKLQNEKLMKLQDENAILLSDFNQMKDELEIYRAQKAMVGKKKKKKAKKTTKENLSSKSSKIKKKKSSKVLAVADRHKPPKIKSSSKLKIKSKVKAKSKR